MYLNHFFTHDPKKKNSRPGFLPAVLAALALSLALLTGCSGTGTMYTPDSFEDDADDPDDLEAAYTGATEAAALAAESYTGAETAAEEMPPRHSHRRKAGAPAADPEEEKRTLRAELEGTGSDLYTAQAVNSYYRFTLDEEAFSLPCPFADLANAGWELVDAGSGTSGNTSLIIPSYSFEYVDAVPAGSSGSSEKIRLCLANFTENDLVPASCTVCGIQVSKDSSAMLKTNFGIGIGDSLESLTSVFGRDPSCYQRTQYNDGICTVRYHFSNGLNENETIPVLAEAEDKSLAELLMAETTEDGNTIRSLSLYFFRLPE